VSIVIQCFDNLLMWFRVREGAVAAQQHPSGSGLGSTMSAALASNTGTAFAALGSRFGINRS
jgi:hypothetical protein